MFTYVIGHDPYHHSIESKTEGNGIWKCKAPSLEVALSILFTEIPYPGEATGRYAGLFLPGVSLALSEDEIIQVWSTDPAIVDRHFKIVKEVGYTNEKDDENRSRHNPVNPHLGSGKHIGLVCEIPVYHIEKYSQPVRKLLGMTSDGSQTLSPIGAAVANFAAKREDMRLAVLGTKFSLIQREWALERKREEMEEQMEKMQQQLDMVTTYLHGVNNTVLLNKGVRSKGKYNVYQHRQFLDQELALLANLVSFDFKEMDKLDSWLISSGAIWKFLPFERTILVTRIRKERKDYGDPFTNFAFAPLNLQNIIWIRDGENVYRVNCEMDFDNAVFPDRNAHDKVLAFVYDSMFASRFQCQEPDGKLGLKEEPWNEEEPYNYDEVTSHRFKTIEAWKDDPEMCPESFQREIALQVGNYLREKNKEQLKFMILIQGIVDNTNLLDVPKGLDLFNWENASLHFELVFDYTHGLPDRTYQNQMKPFMTARKGDWIIVYHGSDTGASWDRAGRPVLFKVQDVRDGKLIIAHRRMSERYNYDAGGRCLVKKPDMVAVKWPYMRVDVPLELAKKILDDREWKMENQWVVPCLAQWESIKPQLHSLQNQKEIELERAKVNVDE